MASGQAAPDSGVISVTPDWVAAHPEVTVVDLRPHEERVDELGFIPGSVRCEDEDKLMELCRSTQVVLVCMSGRRSQEQTTRLAGRGVAALDMRGGLLAWRAHGLATCEPFNADPALVPALDSLHEAPRKIASCFVAELVEVALDQEEHEADELDPLQMFQALFERLGVSWEAPDIDGLYAVLDAAAESRRMGNSVERVAHNLARFYTAVLRLDPRAPA
jgi:rhodanese-related sulfurtransferase